MRPTLCIPVTEPSQVGDARRRVSRLAEERGLGERAVARAAIVATELAGNLVKHADGGGEILARALVADGPGGVELLALDRGPGMTDVARCLSDGYSTTSSPGTGLGAVSRLADLFQVHSAPGSGTAVLARVHAEGEPPAPQPALGAVSVPKPGQPVCGDAWAVVRREGRVVVMVVDGLGHGAGAEEASREAVRVFLANARRPGTEVMALLHTALRPTRGAAVSIAEMDAERAEVGFVGVGNVAGTILGRERARNLVSHNGIVGHEMRRVQEFRYPWAEDDTLVLHSDGILSRWDASRYPGLMGRHPALVAGVLYRDFRRGTDDATLVVVREG